MTLSLIPQPVELSETPTRLRLPHEVAVSGAPAAVAALTRLLGPGTGLSFVRDGSAANALVRVNESSELGASAYRLVVDAESITITHGDAAGLIHAITTLHQLLPASTHGRGRPSTNEFEVPGVVINDAPAMTWRGVHLDVARHFFPLASLFDFIDLLALHKINIFHLHLTEDQGWRFEVKKYPKLTEVGAVRAGTQFPADPEHDQVPHGGYYTQEQLTSLVNYARDRAITIVPEIDLPGHAMALLAAYPEFGEPTADPVEVATSFGIKPQVMHLSDEAVAMVKDVLSELLEVFDSPWIHIGGDECPREQWQNSEAAKKLADERGLASVDELQRWFTEELRTWLAERDRILVGWDEIIDEAIVDGAVVMSWRGTEPGLRAIAAGNEIVMAPEKRLYFDYYQSESPDEPLAIGGHTPLETVITYDPYEGIPDEQRERMLGIQGQLWTEYVIHSGRLEYLAHPRISALAEVAWTGRPGDPAEFTERLVGHLQRLDARGINYRPLDGPHPWQRGGGRYRRRPR